MGQSSGRAADESKLLVEHLVQISIAFFTRRLPLATRMHNECIKVGERVCVAGCLRCPTPPWATGMEGEPACMGYGLVDMRPQLLLQLGQPTQSEWALQRQRPATCHLITVGLQCRTQYFRSFSEVQQPVGVVFAPWVEVFIGAPLAISTAQGTCGGQRSSVSDGLHTSGSVRDTHLAGAMGPWRARYLSLALSAPQPDAASAPCTSMRGRLPTASACPSGAATNPTSIPPPCWS